MSNVLRTLSGPGISQPHPQPNLDPAPAARRAARHAWRRPLLRQPRHVLVSLLMAAVAAGAAATVWPWWRGMSIHEVSTLSDMLILMGRLTGLLGAYLLLLQVILVARIPWLERRIGSDWLTRVHRVLGTYLVAILLSHVALLITGLTLLDHAAIGRETIMVVRTYPDVLMATVALALLVGVGALSARGVRRRLGYETWQFTHVYAYPAGVLAFAHQTTGGTNLGHGTARVAWTAAHLLAAACVVRFRLWRPLALARRHRLRVHHLVEEADGVVSIYVAGHHLERLGAEAGQYFRWRFLARGMWWQAHPFSLSAAPTPRMLRLTVKAVGDHTRALQRLRPGVRVVAEGPYGALTGLQRTRRRVLLLGAGIGITPLRALLEALPSAPGDIALVFRGESAAALVFARELEALAAKREAPVHLVLGSRPGCCPRHDLLSAWRLQRLVPDVVGRDVYVCGPPGMVETARRALRAAGVPRRRIHTERFDF